MQSDEKCSTEGDRSTAVGLRLRRLDVDYIDCLPSAAAAAAAAGDGKDCTELHTSRLATAVIAESRDSDVLFLYMTFDRSTVRINTTIRFGFHHSLLTVNTDC